MLTRRTFLKALAAGAAGLALPLDAAEALVAPARRLWALDGTMLSAPNAAKVPLWVEIDGRRLPVANPVARTRAAAFPRQRGVLTAAEVAAFRQLDRLAAASWRGTLTTLRVDAPPGAYPIVRVD